MNHQEVVRLMAVEQYLLDELADPLRDQFEEHFFECQECALDLRAGSAFIEAAKAELRRHPVTSAATGVAAAGRPATSRRDGSGRDGRNAAGGLPASWFAGLFRPAYVAAAFTLLVAFIGYQNIVVYPQLGGDLTELRNPEVLPAVSLVGGNSRGGSTPSVTVANGKAILVSLDVPTREKYASYDLTLIDPSGAAAWHVQISAEQAKDTVSLRIPTAHWAAGEYSLNVRGQADGASSQSDADLAHYRFTFTKSN